MFRHYIKSKNENINFFISKLILITLFLSFSCKPNCEEFKIGTFTYKSIIDGNISKIVRTKNQQTEYYGKTGRVVQFNLKWVNNCTYKLFNRKHLKGIDDNSHHLDTTYFEITEIKQNQFKVKSKFKGLKNQYEVWMTKIN